MSANLPTNRRLSCTAKSLSNMPALVTPASTELATMQGAPVGKLVNVRFADLQPTLAEGDLLVSDSDATERYRIRGVNHTDTNHLGHTYALGEKGLT